MTIAPAGSSLSGNLARAGIVAGVLYTAIVVVGGLITPGYDHVADPVSSLYQSGSEHGFAIAVAFGLYNAFVGLFGFGVYRIAAASGGPRAAWGRAAGVATVITGVVGAIDDVFPQDPIGSAATTAGALHIVFAGLDSLFTMVAIGLVAAWLWSLAGRRRLAWFSVFALAFVFVSGGVAGASAANLSPQMGLFERFAIFGFIVWMLVASFQLGLGDLTENGV